MMRHRFRSAFRALSRRDQFEDGREARGLRAWDELTRTVGYAARVLRKSPSLTITALATLALCLGANLAIFAVVDSVLLRPLPFPEADRLVRVFNTYPRAGVPDDGASITNYYERRGQIGSFGSLAIHREGSAIVGEPGSTAREWVMRVSPDFFATLGIVPAVGREFTDEDMTPDTSRVAIVTDAYWRQHLGADPGVVGRSIRVNGYPHTVLGVLPDAYTFLSSKARMYLPLASSPEERTPARRHNGSSTHMVARLAPGASLGQAAAELEAHNATIGVDYPQAQMMIDAGFHTRVVSLHRDHVAAVGPVLLLVQAGALFLLLIGAGNLVNLLLIRASGRAKELAVRQAIGASRLRVSGEVMVETAVLTFAGGLLGLGVAAAGTRLLMTLGADHLPLGAHVAFDGRVAIFALAGVLLIGVAMGLPIAWYSSRTALACAVRSESRGGTANRAAERVRRSFVMAQIALAFVLLSGTGLLALSFGRAMTTPLGFRPGGVLSGRVSLPGKDYPDVTSVLAFSERLTGALHQQPGVRSAGVSTNVPLGGNNIRSAATAKGYVPGPGESPRGHYSYGVGGDYFATMGLVLIDGRFLTAADTGRPERVCVVDEDFARRYWPGAGAIGQQVFQSSREEPETEAFTIVGVVGAVKQAELTEDTAQGTVYYPLNHRLDRELFVITRTAVAPESFAATLRQVVRQIDAELPVDDIQPMDARIAESLIVRRSPAVLVALFSGLALLLTAIGTYGVLSYAVSYRRREIGLRMALGALPAQVRRQFLRLALGLTGGGLLLGMAGAWLSGRAMQAMLFQVPALHVATLAVAAALMTSVSLAACLLPTNRAARMSPMEALADE